MDFDDCIHPCNCHQNQDNTTFPSSPEVPSHPFSASLLTTHPRGNHCSDFCYQRSVLPSSEININTVWNILGFSVNNNVFKIPPCCFVACISSSFLRYKIVPLYQHIAVCSSILQLVDVWVASSFLWDFLCMWRERGLFLAFWSFLYRSFEQPQLGLGFHFS